MNLFPEHLFIIAQDNEIALEIHLTFEQHELELCGSTYMGIFFSVVNTTIPRDAGLVESVDGELQIRRSRGCGACMYVLSPV